MKDNLLSRRLLKEKKYNPRRNRNAPILSENPKTGLSLNLPVKNCMPTKACAANCYACQGPSIFRDAIKKSIAVDNWIRKYPKWAAEKTALEALGSPIRLNGSGDMTLAHVPYVKQLLQLGVQFFGFTKRPETWEALSEIGVQIMFSVDITMDKSRLNWAIKNVPKNRLAYCRRPNDPDWSKSIGVTFPEHGSLTNNKDRVHFSKTDCPAIRKHLFCSQCRICF